ncbi:MAG: ABC transporter permease [Tumebacillaceae bacterium]
MRDLEHLYQDRLRAAYIRGTRVVTLIFKNVMILFLIVGALAYLSAQYTKLLQSHTVYPYAMIIAALLTLLLYKSSVRTLLREADLVFLLPAEPRMPRYFRAALQYSSTVQVLWMLVLLFFLYPLYHVKLGTTPEFFGIALLVLLLKVWNIYTVWMETLMPGRTWFRKMLRFGANLCMMLAVFLKMWPLAACFLAWPIVLWLYNRPIRKRLTVPWTRLLGLEEKRLSTYYAIANFFVEIPRVKNRVRRRDWAVALLNKLPMNRKQPYFFLFARTFVRNSEYSGIYFRLLLTAAVLLVFIRNPYLALIVYLLDIYLVGFQLPNIGSELRYPDIIRIYPLTLKQKEQGFSWLAFCLLITQTVLLAIPMLFGPLPVLTSLLYLVVGILFSYYLSFRNLPKRFMRMADESDEENEKKS